MKKKKFSALLAVLFVIIFSFGRVSAQEKVESITNFVSDVTFNKDATINVKEEIHYYFPESKHGIYREIPVDYKTDGSFKRSTKFILNDLFYYPEDDPSAKKKAYSESYENGYKVFKIGEENSYVQGNYVYILDYTLKYAVNYFEDHDELYLNITGDSWEVPILSSQVVIHLPANATNEICYTGVYGSTEQNCSIDSSVKKNIKVKITQPLNIHEGYTVAVSLPKGSVANTKNEQKIQWVLSNIGILLPIPVLLLVIKSVRKKGKNTKLTIIPNYHSPKDMYPILSGLLYSKNLQNKYITADLIDLAVRGYLKIKQISKKKYELIRTSKEDGDLDNIEKELLSGLFKDKESIELNKISTSFYSVIRRITTEANQELYSRGLFSKDRKKMRTKLIILGILCLGFSIFFGSFLALAAANGWTIGILISGVICLFASGAIDIRSEDGNKMYYELLGLKMYISTAEEKRIEFHNNPKKYLGVFEKLLPYAMIFNLEKKWAKEFEDLYTTPPDWYIGDIDRFNTYVMIDSLNRMNSVIQKKTVQPGSSGGFRTSHGASGGSGFSGGSSGGGFGGGGGGSW